MNIKLQNADENCIGDVLYVLGPHQNLFNVGQLSEKGYNTHINHSSCNIYDVKETLIAKVRISIDIWFL